MLTDELFAEWCRRNQIPPETEVYIQRIRTSQPVRKVRSGISNICGRYPSVKMGRTIQFESQHVELWGIYEMERDDDVLEFYDQPTRLQLRYRARSGRNTTQWHTPDFFVIRRESAGFEEWKKASAVEGLTITMPERYMRHSAGGWKSPPGETAASVYGLSYRVRTDAELHPLYIQNLKFLQDFWIHEYPVTASQETQVLTCLETAPGFSVAEVLSAFPDVPVDVIWALLTHNRVFANLSAASLMQWDQAQLYSTAEEAEHDGRVNTSLGDPLPLFIRIRFDGRLWEAETQGETVQVRPEIGSPLTLPARMLQHLLTTGQAVEAKADTPSTITEEARELWLSAGPKQVERANQRLFTILAYVNGEPISFTKRAAQNWLKAFRQAEVRYGYGYLGLVDNFARRGNRGSRVETASKELLLAFLKNHYAVPQAKRASAVYTLYREECEKQRIAPVSSATFYRERKRFQTPEVVAMRRGKRAAYQERPWFFSLDQTTPRHGERPFAIAHLDHTKLDIELVSSITSKPLARPWLTFLTDAYSRRILAAHVSYEEPSYRSAMMTFRLCVQRYGRLPQELVVDHGPDFNSVYFEALLAQCFITKIERPIAEPHAGAVIERLFGKTQVDFLQQLRGNTQATKVPRLLTREIDPKRLAVWTLERFTIQLREYVHEVYDQMEHSALFMSPREAYTQGMLLAGARSHRIIPYTDAFVMQTRPTTRTGAAKIHRSRGITVNGLQYWNERMHASDIAGHSVPVRFEPYDMGVIYAFIDGQWLECIADNYAQVHGRSEKEWDLILEEWREHQRQHSQKRQTLNGPLLAQFLQQVEQEQKVALQHQRDYEEQALRHAVLQPYAVEVEPKAPPLPIVIDFARIPTFEEYR